MIFLYINLTGKDTIHFLWFDIPKLKVDRFHSVTSIFSGDFFSNVLKNFKDGIILIWVQDDSLPWNSVKYFGTIYLITLPFSVIGLFRVRTLRSRLLKGISREEISIDFTYDMLRIWLVVSLMMMCILSNNINRLNVIWLPLTFLAALGIENMIQIQPMIKCPVSILYTGCFIGFSIVYSTKWNKEIVRPYFFYGLKEAIQYTDSIETDSVYLSDGVNYTMVLYYTEYDVHDYIETVEFYNPGSAFENPKSFGKYNFYLPGIIKEGSVYLVKTETKYEAYYEFYETKTFGDYTVLNATVKLID